ncbi:hypothetical protein AVEN_35828-1 [Araneus ventricosus]|uniref:Tc1-like transposase DDE domain-containing protein n=1 Tax=Araneus ventricosus TaxID=182803 RepID=A0A4Y2BM05_ARAVE|nr:hypothetical protein AVEN_35828-1 [Araneus ventricosus]
MVRYQEISGVLSCYTCIALVVMKPRNLPTVGIDHWRDKTFSRWSYGSPVVQSKEREVELHPLRPTIRAITSRLRPHRTDRVFEVLEEHFVELILALGYPEATGMGIAWPPYFPDLNACDSFLWGNIRDKGYANNPETIAELKTAIQEVIECIDI